MAILRNKLLFFTTSPRTPEKMIPEINLLIQEFSGKKWNHSVQEQFADSLKDSNFFLGKGSSKDKAFSDRDRINRAPKALGFVDLKPVIQLTEAGNQFVYGKRPRETFLRQLLKFQLPSPYHKESRNEGGNFFIRPYLEILRLIYELRYITFDEFKIFAVQLTNFHEFNKIKSLILQFREEKTKQKGIYKRYMNQLWTDQILKIYRTRIEAGKTRTRETKDNSLKKFILTQKGNMRDYTDACFRYLRYTGLISIKHQSKSISIFEDKIRDVEFILKTVPREPVFTDDEKGYKAYLFNSNIPELYVDDKENIIDILMKIGSFTKRELVNKSIEDLKDLRDKIVQKNKAAIISKEILNIKSYALYSEIIDTFNEIISDGYYDAPLMLEYNTWRAMTMIDGGRIKGNFNFDDAGKPLSTAAGNMPDIECDYDSFSLSVEVTMQQGHKQYEMEGEPVARHYGQMKRKQNKETYCLFIAPSVNESTYAHFYGLNHCNIKYYGGKTKIIPLELAQFMKLVEISYVYKGHPTSKDIKEFLDGVIAECDNSINEIQWEQAIQTCVDRWLM